MSDKPIMGRVTFSCAKCDAGVTHVHSDTAEIAVNWKELALAHEAHLLEANDELNKRDEQIATLTARLERVRELVYEMKILYRQGRDMWPELRELLREVGQ